MRQRSRMPIKKLVAGGASGATLGPAFTLLIIFTLQSLGSDPPDAVKTAIGTIVTWLAFALAAYFTPPAAGDKPVEDVG